MKTIQALATPRKKPVLFRITNNLGIGGVQRRLLELLPRLSEFYEVHVIVYRDRGIWADALEAQGIQVHFVRLRGKWDPVGLWNMTRLLKKHKADIVHGHSLGGNMAAAISGFLAGAKVIIGHMHVCGTHWYAKTTFGKRKQIWQEALLHRLFGNQVLCVSKECRDYFIEHTGLPESKVSVCYNGVAFEEDTPEPAAFDVRARYAIAPDTKVIGWVGRITAAKGLDFLVKTAKDLAAADSGQKFVFMLVGGGDEELTTRLRSEFAPLQDKGVELILAGKQNQVYPYYRAFDVFMLSSPSLAEGFAGVSVEAASMGLPIVSPRTKPIEELAAFYTRIHILDGNENGAQAVFTALALPQAETTALKTEFSLQAAVARTVGVYSQFTA